MISPKLLLLPLILLPFLTSCSQPEQRSLEVEFDKSDWPLGIGTIDKNKTIDVKSKGGAKTTYQLEIKTINAEGEIGEKEESRIPFDPSSGSLKINKTIPMPNGFFGAFKDKTLIPQFGNVDIAIETNHGTIEYQTKVPVTYSNNSATINAIVKVPPEFNELQIGAKMKVRTLGKQEDGDINANIIGKY
jgi:hypothetical protein